MKHTGEGDEFENDFFFFFIITPYISVTVLLCSSWLESVCSVIMKHTGGGDEF